MKKRILLIIGAAILAHSVTAFAATPSPTQAPLAARPAECVSIPKDPDGKAPANCIFLSEPIGGKPNVDLFLRTCGPAPGDNKKTLCVYELYGGGAIQSNSVGPLQAILSFEANKPDEGALNLLYNYLKLIYKFMSGIIVGIAVLVVIFGGVQMSLSGGDQGAVEEARSRITNSLIGLVVWFLASLILYFVNPTFFAFLS